MDSAYTLSVPPDAPAAAAFWGDAGNVKSGQSMVLPSADLINMIFGSIMRQYDVDTDTTQDFTIDEAIVALEEYYQTTKTSGMPATNLMKVFRVLAVTMLQVQTSAVSFFYVESSSSRMRPD